MLLTANNATSTLAASITNSATTISVQTGDASRFPEVPAGDWFPVYVIDGAGNSEIMRCTARAGAILTVERGQEGTTPKSFNSGSRIELRLTSAAIDGKLELDAIRRLPEKTTLDNDDELTILDSAAGRTQKRVLWSRIVAFVNAAASAAASAVQALSLQKAQNLGDVPDKAAARSALSVPSSAELTALDGATLKKSGGLADLTDPALGRLSLNVPSVPEMNSAVGTRLPLAGGTVTGKVTFSGPGWVDFKANSLSESFFSILRPSGTAVAYVGLDGGGAVGAGSGNSFTIRAESGSTIKILGSSGLGSEFLQSGAVVNAANPAFSAYGAYDPFTSTGIGIVVFQTAAVNIGSAYSPSNGRFTAPVAGKYIFHATVFIDKKNTPGAYGYFTFRLNGGNTGEIFHGSNSATAIAYESVSGSIIRNLAAGDFIEIQFVGEGTARLLVGTYNSFSGALLH